MQKWLEEKTQYMYLSQRDDMQLACCSSLSGGSSSAIVATVTLLTDWARWSRRTELTIKSGKSLSANDAGAAERAGWSRLAGEAVGAREALQSRLALLTFRSREAWLADESRLTGGSFDALLTLLTVDACTVDSQTLSQQ